MLWIAPSEKDTANAALEKRLWDAAEQALPAPHFAETEYSIACPEGLLGLIFLRFAEVRFGAQRAELEKASASARSNCELRSPSCEVQSIRHSTFDIRHSTFVIRHSPRLSIHGVKKTEETGRLCRLVAVRKDLAVPGLEGEIKHGGNINSYYDDSHDATSRFDFVLAKGRGSLREGMNAEI